jgi:hypothetical protein
MRTSLSKVLWPDDLLVFKDLGALLGQFLPKADDPNARKQEGGILGYGSRGPASGGIPTLGARP